MIAPVHATRITHFAQEGAAAADMRTAAARAEVHDVVYIHAVSLRARYSRDRVGVQVDEWKTRWGATDRDRDAAISELAAQIRVAEDARARAEAAGEMRGELESLRGRCERAETALAVEREKGATARRELAILQSVNDGGESADKKLEHLREKQNWCVSTSEEILARVTALSACTAPAGGTFGGTSTPEMGLLRECHRILQEVLVTVDRSSESSKASPHALLRSAVCATAKLESATQTLQLLAQLVEDTRRAVVQCVNGVARAIPAVMVVVCLLQVC